MQFFKKTPTIDFVGKRKIAMFFTAILIITSISSLFINWLNLGLDFRGGISVEVSYSESTDVAEVRAALAGSPYSDAVVQELGENIAIRLYQKDYKEKMSAITDEIVGILQSNSKATVEFLNSETVSEKYGEELRNAGGIAVLFALGLTLVYIMLRFEWRFAVGAIAALVHDVIITLGVFSLFQINFDLTVLAAILAVIGYSLNDTIVVYDRIRENFRKIRKGTTESITNVSLNETLSRTLMTSITTLIVLVAMYFLGGDMIRPFSIALIVGVLIGTYSSVYVASSMVLALKIDRTHLLPVQKEKPDNEQQSYP